MNRPGTPTRPAHLRVPLIGLVILGGTAGTAVRNLLETRFAPPVGQFPWPTFVINVTGAFLLGLLLELVASSDLAPQRRRALQLTLGTGLMGGYTTYSTFVLETIDLDRHGGHLMAFGYLAASLVLGFVAAMMAMNTTRAFVSSGKGGRQ